MLRSPGCLNWCGWGSRGTTTTHGLSRETWGEVNLAIITPGDCQCKGYSVWDFLQRCRKLIQLASSCWKNRKSVRFRRPTTKSKHASAPQIIANKWTNCWTIGNLVYNHGSHSTLYCWASVSCEWDWYLAKFQYGHHDSNTEWTDNAILWWSGCVWRPLIPRQFIVNS